ncbi:hypothetical protein T09_10977 [Trichinella sp. T9]|nr:hypothetical protein T09_10977 [Trichinella sp. T9]
MEDMSDLRLVLNCGGSMRLVFEGRAHKLKYTEVTAVINENITLKPARLREQRQVQEMLHQFTTAKLGEEDYITEDREACQGKILGIMEATKVISQKDCIASCPAELSK